VRDGNVVAELSNHAYRGFWSHHLEKTASPQVLAIAQVPGEGTKSSRR
jgi:hypothetical protein